ncbi:hypothetical protein PR202_ga26327 [Eleusine coracana subsp. coracana]|uniref:Uncharacterized protein n=1 Tax=Eleusine coracana subsp. coracana TaxID=191504 RepID=A0AAV5DBP1_ELECO|nr:hypothetical protein PR202_ga26327 [Eleusine coracana subsp. coracana]
MALVIHRRLLLLAAAIAVAAVASLPRPAAAVRPFVLVLSGDDFLKDSAAHPLCPPRTPPTMTSGMTSPTTPPPPIRSSPLHPGFPPRPRQPLRVGR